MNNEPAADLRSLDRLVGTWRLSEETSGTVRFEWLEGGHFLLQHIDMALHGHVVKGLEVIGHLHPFGGEASPEIWSRVYDAEGNTLDYVYELEGDTLTIWGGAKGSPAYFRGEFSADGRINVGGGFYPDGGAYRSTMTREDGPAMPRTLIPTPPATAGQRNAALVSVAA